MKYLELYGELYTDQLELESRYKRLGELATEKMYNDEKATGDVTKTKLGEKFIAHQFTEITTSIKHFVETITAPKRGVKPSFVFILEDLLRLYQGNTTELYNVLATSTFSILINFAFKKEHRISNLSKLIIDEIYDEARLESYTQAHEDKAASVLTGVSKRVKAAYRRAYIKARMEHDDHHYAKWDTQDGLHLAATLIDIVERTSNYFEYHKGDTLQIRPTQVFLDSWARNEDATIQAAFKLCPTVIPPRPWENFNEGGYYGELATTNTLLRLHGTRNPYAKDYMRKLDQLELTDVKLAINAIQATPWVINKQVLDILKIIILKRGGGVAGLPYIHEAPKPAILPPQPTKEQLKKYNEVMSPWYRGEKRRESLALRCLAHIKIAEEFSQYDNIYFPHNMDFRGRVYPIPAFNPQGDDLNKALILFADPPPLENEQDIEWLLIHGANLAGVDKVSYADRIAWVRAYNDEIIQVANDPLGSNFWHEQDSPCQFLAWCFEYKKALDYYKDHKTYVGFTTGIPIAFDGSCSGLQHFSAILRDPIGGQAVNLTPTNKPNDIYQVVADKVNKVIAIDARNGTTDAEKVHEKTEQTYLKFGTKTLAQQWLAFGITRKVTKRSVMTLAYGSKEYGFKEQIFEDTIKPDLDEKDKKSIFYDSKNQAAAYMAKLIWNAVSTTVVKAVEGMKWLQDCSRLVTKEKQVVTWTTPMGLPVQQNYMELNYNQVQLRVSGRRIRLYIVTNTGDIDKRKQSSGIAPNFIHSMDAAHLQLSTCMMFAKGIRHFAMIHDSYGCPLAQATTLNKIVRQAFVNMYQNNDVLENFRSELQEFTTNNLPKPPTKESLDIRSVLDSQYIVS